MALWYRNPDFFTQVYGCYTWPAGTPPELCGVVFRDPVLIPLARSLNCRRIEIRQAAGTWSAPTLGSSNSVYEIFFPALPPDHRFNPLGESGQAYVRLGNKWRRVRYLPFFTPSAHRALAIAAS